MFSFFKTLPVSIKSALSSCPAQIPNSIIVAAGLSMRLGDKYERPL